MGHQHSHHGHRHEGRGQHKTRLMGTLALTVAYMIAEILGGYLADSLALLADAGHMFSDAVALGLSLFAAWIAQRPPTPQHSYGYYRAEILAALANGATLVAIAVLIFVEAVHRISAPEPVRGMLMLSIAAGGLAVNLAGLAILHGGKDENLNLRGAWLHLLTDALGSIAALTAGALIWAFGWYWADPVASMLIALLVIYSAWALLRQAIDILMERTPAHLNSDEVRRAMLAAPGIRDVHDLHIWTITSGMDSLSAHVSLRAGHEPHQALEDLRLVLHEQFGIDHITIQIELAGPEACRTSF